MHEQMHEDLKVQCYGEQQNNFTKISDTSNITGSLFSCNKISQKKSELFKPVSSQHSSKYFASTEVKTRKIRY